MLVSGEQHLRSVARNVRAHDSTARPRQGLGHSWLGLSLEFVEGLGGLAECVGEGLVPVHIGAAGTEFPRALLS